MSFLSSDKPQTVLGWRKAEVQEALERRKREKGLLMERNYYQQLEKQEKLDNRITALQQQVDRYRPDNRIQQDVPRGALGSLDPMDN